MASTVRTPVAALSLLVFLVGVGFGCQGCPPPAPGSREYEPKTMAGKGLMKQARRDVWPDDVRKDLPKHTAMLVAWAGVVAERKVTPDGKTLGIVIDHHYWDWIEDFGAQREHMFLSPRGEGKFAIMETVNERSSDPAYLPVGAMAIVFGKPMQVTPDQLVVLDYQWSITIQKPFYATDFWDYGRAYLEKGDRSDFKRLRTF